MNVEPNQGKSKPYPSELAQTERRNIKRRLADTSKAVTELEKLSNTKLAKTENDIKSELNARISVRVKIGSSITVYNSLYSIAYTA